MASWKRYTMKAVRTERRPFFSIHSTGHNNRTNGTHTDTIVDDVNGNGNRRTSWSWSWNHDDHRGCCLAVSLVLCVTCNLCLFYFYYTNDVTAISHNPRYLILVSYYLNCIFIWWSFDHHADFLCLMTRVFADIQRCLIAWLHVFSVEDLNFITPSNPNPTIEHRNWMGGKRSEREIKQYGSMCKRLPTEGVDIMMMTHKSTHTSTHELHWWPKSTVIISP